MPELALAVDLGRRDDDLGRRREVDADNAQGEAGEERREGRAPWRYVMLQLAEVAVPQRLFADILRRIDRLRSKPVPA